MPDEEVRGMLARLCELHGFAEAADVLRQGCNGGVMTLAPTLADTRDGREEAVQAIQEAYEAERKPIIVINTIGRPA